jgi:predicted nucleic acid-binding protein
VDIPASIATPTHSRDRNDDKFIHTALAAQAPLLVTGDQDLLDVPPLAGLAIVTPRVAWEMMASPPNEPGR